MRSSPPALLRGFTAIGAAAVVIVSGACARREAPPASSAP